MASGASWASVGEITPARGKAAATAVKRRAFRRLRVMFIMRSCGSGILPRIRQSRRTLAVTKLREGKAKERTKFAGLGGRQVRGPQRHGQLFPKITRPSSCENGRGCEFATGTKQIRPSLTSSLPADH